MRKVLLLFTLLPLAALAQGKKKSAKDPSEFEMIHRQVFKVNLSSIGLKTLSFQYEKRIKKRRSFVFGARFMPTSSLPFQSQFKDMVNSNSDTRVGDFQSGNIALTPELRFYLSRGGNMKGFYIAPYLRYTYLKIEGRIDYKDGIDYKSGIASGVVHGLGAGLMVGSQFKLSKRLMLDWWIAGAHIGIQRGDIGYRADDFLTASQQNSLRVNLESIAIPLMKIESTVDQTGATITTTGGWFGLRGLGLCLGYRF